MKWTQVVTLVMAVALLLAAACNGSGTLGFGQDGPGDEPDGRIGPDTCQAQAAGEPWSVPEMVVEKEAALTTFGSCEALGEYLTELSVAELVHYANERVPQARPCPGTAPDVAGGTGWLQDGVTMPIDTAAADMAASPDEWTGTNNQTEGVDEADIVKSDGQYLYIVDDNELVILAAWPPAELRELSRTELAWAPSEMLVHGDTALLMGPPYNVELPEGFASSERYVGYDYGMWGLTLVDLGDRTAPTIRREMFVEGTYLTARLLDGVAHIVLRSSLDRFHGDYGQFQQMGEEAGEDELREQMEEMGADELLPRYYDRVLGEGAAVRMGPVAPCGGIHAPSTPYGMDLLSVLSLDLEEPTAPHMGAAVIGGGATVYASREHLYVGDYKDSHWYYEDLSYGARDVTVLHSFRFEDAGTRYEASGEIEGRLLNQFSLDEHAGYLRAATQTREGEWSGMLDSRVSVLGESGGRLSVVGIVTGIGLGERLYAVRFMGDRGFVVTFRQTDPLFTLDLSDPEAPRVVGELVIPGFSTYLHPYDEDHLLAIGEISEWPSWGVKLSLFDVSDFANPAVVQEIVLGGSSEAQYDHRAFTFYRSHDVLVVPVQGDGYDDTTPTGPGLHVYDVSLETGFSLRGVVRHGMRDGTFWRSALELHCELDPSYMPWCCELMHGWGGTVPRRSFFMDDFLYSISVDGVAVHDLAALETAVASVAFGECPASQLPPDVVECVWGQDPCE